MKPGKSEELMSRKQ